MVNKVNNSAFKKLKKLTPQRRLEIASSPVGTSMLGLLTPSQFADLFPKYWERGLPDVGGFREAISKKSQKAQQDYFDSVDQALGTVSPGAADRARREGRTPGGGRGGGTPGGAPGGGGSYGGSIQGYWTPERQKYAVQYLMEHGKFTQYGAAAAVARMTKEAPGGPGQYSKGDGGQHFGVAQWSKSRAGSIFGVSDLDTQLAHYVKESWTTEKRAGDLFRSAQNPQQGSVAAMHFERAEGYKESGGKTDVLVNKTPVDTVYNNVFGTGTTPSTGGTPTTGSGYKVSSTGHVQPTDEGLYSSKNAQQCATLSKAFNKDIGRATEWKVERNDAAIKPGVVVATAMYNDGTGGSPRHGYHTGVALSTPDKNGDFWMLDQFSPNSNSNGQAAIRQYNVKSYKMQGNYFGIINGRTEISVDALKFAKSIAGKNHPALTHIDAQLKFFEDMQTGKQSGDPKKEIAKTDAAQIKTVVASSPVPPPPEAKQVIEQTAKVNKPKYNSFKFDPEAYYTEVDTKHPEAKYIGYPKERIMKETYQGFEEAQAAGAIKWNKKTNEILIIDPNHEKVKRIYKDMKDNNIEKSKFLFSQGQKEAAAESKTQTASLGERLKKEFAGTAQAQEAGDAFAREAAYRKTHVYGPEMPSAGVDAVKMRQKIEAYYGQKIGDHEYDMLIRATHGESSAKKHSPQEQAMIMGTILNRAKKEGGVEKALMRNKQFESVTGRTRGKFSPNPAYKAGPSARRMESMYSAAMDYLHNVSPDQKYFTSKYGDKTAWNKKVTAMGGDTHGGTIFGTKLGTGPAPGVAAVPQTPAPGPTPVQDASLGQRITKELSPVTPAQAATPTPKPTPKPEAPEFPKSTGGTPTPPTKPTAIVAPPPPVKAPDESSTQNFLKSQGIGQKVPGASNGGSFGVNGDVSFYPMDKRDNLAAVDTKTQQPLFTAKGGERIDVTPSQKVQGNMGPTDNGMRSEFEALRQQMAGNSQGSIEPPKTNIRQRAPERVDQPNFINELQKQNKSNQYHNSAFERAMMRTRLQESGDPLNGHFSNGNTNYG
jgi:hypothetical protein